MGFSCSPLRRLTAALLLGLSGWANAATYTVTTTNDSGAGSFREGLAWANTNAGADTIVFNIPGSPPYTINLASELPNITGAVIIDATTQSGFAVSNKPVVVLNGLAVAGLKNGLTLTATGISIRGLVINNFGSYGVELFGGGSNAIQSCFIGTDVNGTAAQPNGYGGLHIAASSDNVIGGTNSSEGNLISGNRIRGIHLEGGASRNTIWGNWIGAAWGGMAALSNETTGIRISSSPDNVIGGAVAGARNIISGNGESGVAIEGSASTNNRVLGNFVGLNQGGMTALPNAEYGVRLVTDARNNFIGGTNAGEGNVVSGNRLSGVALSSGARNNSIQGNLIGTSQSGTVAVPNLELGVAISSATNNLIGGTVAGARNVISGNVQSGVYLLGSASRNNRIEGNYIGVDVTGTNRLGNGYAGVWLSDAPLNFVGSPVVGGGNVISGNGFHGIYIQNAGAFSNSICGNRIGTDVTGTKVLWSASGFHGIVVDDAPSNLIGGTTAEGRNIISGNYNGIALAGNSAVGNTIQGNYISTDISGMIAARNFDDGIKIGISGTPANTLVGGSAAGAGNLISGGGYRGIYAKSATGTVIQGNRLGLKMDLSGPLKNGVHNIDTETNSVGTTIGGNNPGEGNVIAFAPNNLGYDGVRIRSGSNATKVLGNSIYQNGDLNAAGLGIDIGTDGVTANDACDIDAGANNAQNFPSLTSGISDGLTTVVKGYLESAMAQTYLLQFYASPSTDSSGYGEGKFYLGSANVTLGGACSNVFVATMPNGVATGWVVSATATDAANNTSEFSQTVTVGGVLGLNITPSVGSQATLSWLVTNAYGGSWQLVEATNLTPPIVWLNVTNSPIVASNGTWFTVTVPATNSSRFYRLRYQ